LHHASLIERKLSHLIADSPYFDELQRVATVSPVDETKDDEKVG